MESKNLGKNSRENRATKFIFVTGGVISGVGKGTAAASIGAILKAQGAKVSMQKLDPYFNIDAGLLNPAEHGECFVTRDGAETDLDLGSYERFLDEEMTDDSIATSGKLFAKLLTKERAGEFHGKSVQMVPHFTGLIQETIRASARRAKSDVHIVEIGGTVGDLEGAHFLEAIREMPSLVGRENCFYFHVVFVPDLSTSEEFKTKPAQNALRDLREFGIIPDMVGVRLDVPSDQLTSAWADKITEKLATFGGVSIERVMLLPNADSVYDIPLNMLSQIQPISDFANLHKKPDMKQWEGLRRQIQAKPTSQVTIGLVAKYVDNSDTYKSVGEALHAAAWAQNVGLTVCWINAEKLEKMDQAQRDKTLSAVDGLVVPGGFGVRGLEGKIAAADYALAHDKPYLGLCLGLQMAVIAAARRGGLQRATSEEIEPNSFENVIYIMPDQKGKESTGGTMRLGNYPAKLVAGSKTAKIYGKTDVIERHRHRYEVNQKFLPQIAKGGLVVSGTSPDGKLVEFVEAPEKKFFVATQAHPEFRSRPTRPHPLFVAFINAAKEVRA